ncbi:molybdenum cofactor guanylyltransferase [Alteromonas sp.]|nr:molybdenum cofactor guanylyltransferase [Alteromonas sp.]
MKVISNSDHVEHLPHQHCLGFILAGGRSSRMGIDKAMVSVGGQTMLQIAHSVLHKAQIYQQFVVGGQYADINEKNKGLGPARAICDVLLEPNTVNAESNNYALFMPVDMPFLTSASLRKLLHLARKNRQAFYFKEHYLPFVTPWSVEMAQRLKGVSEAYPSPSVRNVLHAINAKSVTFSGELRELANINSPVELIKATGGAIKENHNTRLA